jgi:hypothetical protein
MQVTVTEKKLQHINAALQHYGLDPIENEEDLDKFILDFFDTLTYEYDHQ